MKFGDLRQQLENYESLPDDLTIRMNAEVPPLLPMICRECGEHYRDFQLSWSEVRRELDLGRADKEYQLVSICPKCEKTLWGDEDEEDEEE